MWATGAITPKTSRPYHLASRLLDVTVLYDGGDPRRREAFLLTSLNVSKRITGMFGFENHFRLPREWADPLIGIVHFRLNFFPAVCGLDVYIAFSNVSTKEIKIVRRMGVEEREKMVVSSLGQ